MAKKINDANKKFYFTTINDGDRKYLSTASVADKWPVKLWLQGKDKEAEDYVAESFDEQGQVFFLKRAGGMLSKLAASKLLDKEVFVKVGEGKNQFFFVSFLRQAPENKAYYITLPGDIYRSQQRSNYRLMANNNNKIQFKVFEEVYDGLDISAGGTSFMIQDSQKDTFTKGTEFTNCKLRFNRVDFDIPLAKVAGQWEQLDTEERPTGEIKVGIQFLNLTDAQEEKLFQHINSEARAEEMRKKMAASRKK